MAIGRVGPWGQWRRLRGSPGRHTGPDRAPGRSAPPPWVEAPLLEGLRRGKRPGKSSYKPSPTERTWRTSRLSARRAGRGGEVGPEPGVGARCGGAGAARVPGLGLRLRAAHSPAHRADRGRSREGTRNSAPGPEAVRMTGRVASVQGDRGKGPLSRVQSPRSAATEKPLGPRIWSFPSVPASAAFASRTEVSVLAA